jgi:pimeloyl-ACP methyl ester carboxylesterase
MTSEPGQRRITIRRSGTKAFRRPIYRGASNHYRSDFDGAAADGAPYRKKFSGKYSHRVLRGIGHNVPQEAPQAFAQAVVDVDAY